MKSLKESDQLILEFETGKTFNTKQKGRISINPIYSISSLLFCGDLIQDFICELKTA